MGPSTFNFLFLFNESVGTKDIFLSCLRGRENFFKERMYSWEYKHILP